MKRRRALAAALALATSAPIVAAAPVSADDAAPADATTSWSVQPVAAGDGGRPYFVYELDPGTVVHDELRIANLGTTEVSLALYASDAFNHPDGTFDVDLASAAPEGIGAWITTVTRAVTVGPGATVTVPFELAVPAEAAVGDHAGGIVTSLAVRSGGTGGADSVVEHRVGARVYLRVRGALAPSYAVEDVHLSRDGGVLGTGDITVTYALVNTGNVRLRATTDVEVGGPFGLGSTGGAGTVVEDLLPGARVELTERLAGTVPVGRLGASVAAEVRTAGDGALALEPSQRSTARWDVVWWQVVLLAAGAGEVARRTLRRRRARATRASAPPPALADTPPATASGGDRAPTSHSPAAEPPAPSEPAPA